MKAWQRRASARKSQGDILGHIQDLDSALQLAPESCAISHELRQALTDFLSSQGLTLPLVLRHIMICMLPVDVEAPVFAQIKASAEQPSVIEEHGKHTLGQVSHAHRDSLETTEECSTAIPTNVAIHSPSCKPVPSISALEMMTLAQSKSTPDGMLQPHSAPTTSADFEVMWRGMKGCMQGQAVYLCLIKPSMISKIFGSTMTPGLLESIVRTALDSILHHRNVQHHVDILDSLTSVDRFRVNLMLISKSAKVEIGDIWRSCEACNERGKWQVLLRRIRGKFFL